MRRSRPHEVHRPARHPRSYWFAVALAAAIVSGMLVAWTPQFWAATVLHSALLLTGLAWFFFAKQTPGDWALPLQALPVGIIAVWGWLQLGFLGTVARFLTKIRSIDWAIIAIAFCLSFQILRNGRARSIFLAIVMWASAALSILAVLQMYSSPNQVLWLFPAEDYSVGTFLYKNQFVAMVELAVPISLYWMLFRPSRRMAGIFAFIALFGGAIASGSRAGFSLVVVECIVAMVVAYSNGKLKLAYLIGIVPATLLFLGAAALLFGNEAILAHFQESHPYAIRQELLKTTVQMYKQEPWSGYGLGAWSTVYPAYATFDVGRVANAAHNDWAEWAAEGGFLFAGSILVFFALLIKPAIQSVWGLGIVSLMLHSWVDYPTREPVLCVFWFCMAGALLASRKNGLEEGA